MDWRKYKVVGMYFYFTICLVDEKTKEKQNFVSYVLCCFAFSKTSQITVLDK